MPEEIEYAKKLKVFYRGGQVMEVWVKEFSCQILGGEWLLSFDPVEPYLEIVCTAKDALESVWVIDKRPLSDVESAFMRHRSLSDT